MNRTGGKPPGPFTNKRLAAAVPVVDAWLARERERAAAGRPVSPERRSRMALTILAAMLNGGRRGSDAMLARSAVELTDALLRQLG